MTPASAAIEWSASGEVAELCLAQPPLNEIGLGMLEALERCLDALEQRMPRAVVVYSAMSRGFCAGADLRGLYGAIAKRGAAAHGDELASFLDRIHAVMDRLDTLPVTTFGAVHGPCFGGGFELALTLDVLVADTTARFCFPELRLGIIPGFGGIPRLRREVGNAVIRDLVLTGRSINAKKAAELGFVSQVVGAGRALEVAREVAEHAARFEPGAIRSAKRFIKAVPSAELAEEKRRFLELFARPGVLQALSDFVAREDLLPYLPAEKA